MGAPVKIQTSPLRRAAFERDRGICGRCSADCEKIKRIYWRYLDAEAQIFYGELVRYNDKVFWEADHIIERADKGADAIENIQTLCRACHQKKTAESKRARVANRPLPISGDEILDRVESVGAGLKIGGPTGLWREWLFDDEILVMIKQNRTAVVSALRTREGQAVRPATIEFYGHIA